MRTALRWVGTAATAPSWRGTSKPETRLFKFPENIFGEKATNRVAKRIATLKVVCRMRIVCTPPPGRVEGERRCNGHIDVIVP